jgi:hypothetical protein
MVAVAVAAASTVLTAGVLFDRIGTERVLAWRPWTLLGLLLVVLDLRLPAPETRAVAVPPASPVPRD